MTDTLVRETAKEAAKIIKQHLNWAYVTPLNGTAYLPTFHTSRATVEGHATVRSNRAKNSVDITFDCGPFTIEDLFDADITGRMMEIDISEAAEQFWDGDINVTVNPPPFGYACEECNARPYEHNGGKIYHVYGCETGILSSRLYNSLVENGFTPVDEDEIPLSKAGVHVSWDRSDVHVSDYHGRRFGETFKDSPTNLILAYAIAATKEEE